MITPQYKVSWIQHQKQYTFAFFKPEPALKLAITIVKQGYTLLSIDQ